MEMTAEAFETSLEEVLRGQVKTIEILRDSQKRLLESVRARDWVVLAKESAVIEELSVQFKGLEKELESLLSLAADNGEKLSFYRAVATLPKEKRQHLNNLFRELKRLLVLSKTENSIFTGLVAGEKTSLSELLEHIVPSKRGSVYTKSGALSSGKEEGLVLDGIF